MTFGLKVVKHVKSNAIAFVNEHQTLALGGGATSRVDPVHAAREKAARTGISLKGSVLASDAFFPFPDGLVEAVKAGRSPSSNQVAAYVTTRSWRQPTLRCRNGDDGVRHFRH
jgi:hypothetical protein